jgi:rod shape-determining protein MreD
MRVLAPAVGAFIAAILESSVMTHLQVGDIRPDLVFAVGIALAMVLGFESGMTWAFIGGVSLDLLMPGRTLGAGALALILGTAVALLVARAMWPPRILVIAATAVVLTPLYQGLMLAALVLTADVSASIPSLTDLAVVALINGAIAALGVVVVRAIDLRFGDRERLAW